MQIVNKNTLSVTCILRNEKGQFWLGFPRCSKSVTWYYEFINQQHQCACCSLHRSHSDCSL